MYSVTYCHIASNSKVLVLSNNKMKNSRIDSKSISTQGRSLVLSIDVGRAYGERGNGSLKSAMLKAASLKDNFQQGDCYEQYQYFYHPDHLGSSSFITNTEGEVVQHIEYVPYGEVFIEERNNVWNTPYLFNAKEFDEETGLYYYGARYYDSRLSMWYGVDALAEKYPNMSPYNYCVGNPVKFVDSDGNKIKGFKIMNGNVTITKSASKDAIKIYNTMSKTTIGLKAFKSMILVPTKIKNCC